MIGYEAYMYDKIFRDIIIRDNKEALEETDGNC